jgi:hypothetical protein
MARFAPIFWFVAFIVLNAKERTDEHRLLAEIAESASRQKMIDHG